MFSIGDIWSIRGSGHVLTVGQGDTGQLGLGEDVMEKTRPQVRVLLDVQHYKLRLRKLKNYFTWNSRWLLALSLQWMLLLEACTLLCWTPTERLLFWNGTFLCKWTGFSGLDFWLQRRRIPGQDNWGGGRELSAWRGLDHICDYEASILSNRWTQVNLPSKVVMICCGDSHTAALTQVMLWKYSLTEITSNVPQEGEVFAWGTFRDSSGPIGLTEAGQLQKTPIKIMPGVQVRFLWRLQTETGLTQTKKSRSTGLNKTSMTQVVKICSGSDHLVMLTRWELNKQLFALQVLTSDAE